MDAGWRGVSYQGGSGSFVHAIYADTANQYLYVGGEFDSAGNVFAERVARWDESTWFPMSSPDLGQNDFLLFNGELYNAGQQVEKWNGSGWDLIDPYFNGTLGELIEYNGKLLAGGAFTTASGATVNGIALLDSSGQWQPFPGGGVSGGGFASASSMVYYNGDLIVAGDFDYAGGVACNNIARWDGSQWHPLGSGTAGSSDIVTALGVFQNKLYVSGGFDSAGGVNCDGFAGWDGVQWESVEDGFNLSANCFLTHNNYLYAGGLGTFGNCVLRFDGVSWQSMGPFLSAYIYSIAILDGVLFVAGDFIEEFGSNFIYDIAQQDLITGQWQPVSFSEEIKVHPNPATDKVYLSASLTEAKVSIINSLGQLVLQTTTRSNEPIDVSALPAGFYSLLLTSQKKREAVSFIKQ